MIEPHSTTGDRFVVRCSNQRHVPKIKGRCNFCLLPFLPKPTLTSADTSLLSRHSTTTTVSVQFAGGVPSSKWTKQVTVRKSCSGRSEQPLVVAHVTSFTWLSNRCSFFLRPSKLRIIWKFPRKSKVHAVPHSGFSQQRWTDGVDKHIKRYSNHINDIKENKVILETPKKMLKPSSHNYVIVNLMNYLHVTLQILQMERHERIGNKDLARLAHLLQSSQPLRAQTIQSSC